MSIYNGAAQLARTMDSISKQTEADFELIVVDDGSTDDTSAILSALAERDPRIRVITQQNAGLTAALIHGCAAARAPFIARHDCGDVSAPDRFERQLAMFAGADVVLTSCWARYVGPDDELLYDVRADGDEVIHSLLHDDVRTIRALPHHGTAMFRRESYLAVGGYRDAFRYAQDLDLWVRLARLGRVAVVPEILYETRFEPRAISASKRREQIALAEIALHLRDESLTDEQRRVLMEQARRIGVTKRPGHRRDEARALYFIASCLRRNGDLRYKRYVRAALRLDPLNPRAWFLFMKR
jgi:glycosyltransferase involved in cell wall biosynthesis